jgi:hypothetical protein
MTGKGFRFGSRTREVNEEVMKERASGNTINENITHYRADNGLLIATGDTLYAYDPVLKETYNIDDDDGNYCYLEQHQNKILTIDEDGYISVIPYIGDTNNDIEYIDYDLGAELALDSVNCLKSFGDELYIGGDIGVWKLVNGKCIQLITDNVRGIGHDNENLFYFNDSGIFDLKSRFKPKKISNFSGFATVMHNKNLLLSIHLPRGTKDYSCITDLAGNHYGHTKQHPIRSICSLNGFLYYSYRNRVVRVSPENYEDHGFSVGNGDDEILSMIHVNGKIFNSFLKFGGVLD